jgi:hypothetical protein
MLEDSEARGREDPWLHMGECIELEFIPNNFNYISRCKFCDLVNTINDNLRQYVKVYTEFMLEIWHMHELDWCAIL